IKSGGEWISSVELEKAALGHPEVAQAAVIAVPHRKWLERPLLLVVRREGASVDAASLLAFMRPLIARWWLPDAVEFVDSLPMTGVGKLDKRSLRAAYADYRLNDAAQPKDAAR
ncbi:MAG: AMP-binding enzyme, partial [Janthinobacterium lividum]